MYLNTCNPPALFLLFQKGLPVPGHRLDDTAFGGSGESAPGSGLRDGKGEQADAGILLEWAERVLTAETVDKVLH